MLIVTSSMTAPRRPLKCCASAAWPRAVVDSMAAVSAKSAPVHARMDPAGAIMIGNTPDFFARSLTNQRQGALEVIRDAGITLG
jgi:hypothetical protein